MSSSEGNRVWRVESAKGPLALKRYAMRNSPVADAVRSTLTWLWRRKSSPTARGRRHAEFTLLRHWRQLGYDVPRVWKPEELGLGDANTLLIEWIDGPTLLDLVRRKANTPPEQRHALLRKLGDEMGRRHERALADNDPALIQEHGSAAHVFVSEQGGSQRLVRFDHEQAFLPGQDVLPLITKEVAATLRSLAKKTDPSGFDDDLAAWVAGYNAPDLLRALVDEAFHSDSLARRCLWWLDRAFSRRQKSPHKFDVLDALRALSVSPPQPARAA
ncbi:MAG: hypothetical protein DHS20C15_23780 [Planctomycetota bacterium]|nr:MAG: hypothetical protein DHS20C15_23780 [Planctomycetota bacterium]